MTSMKDTWCRKNSNTGELRITPNSFVNRCRGERPMPNTKHTFHKCSQMNGSVSLKKKKLLSGIVCMWKHQKGPSSLLGHHQQFIASRIRKINLDLHWMSKQLLADKCVSNSKKRSQNLWDLCISVQFSHSVMSDSLQPHAVQHARLPCPSPTPGDYSNSCPSRR